MALSNSMEMLRTAGGTPGPIAVFSNSYARVPSLARRARRRCGQLHPSSRSIAVAGPARVEGARLRRVRPAGRRRRHRPAAAGPAGPRRPQTLAWATPVAAGAYCVTRRTPSRLYGVDTRDDPDRTSAGARMVGGQEDMIVDVALDILKQREVSATERVVAPALIDASVQRAGIRAGARGGGAPLKGDVCEASGHYRRRLRRDDAGVVTGSGRGGGWFVHNVAAIRAIVDPFLLDRLIRPSLQSASEGGGSCTIERSRLKTALFGWRLTGSSPGKTALFGGDEQVHLRGRRRCSAGDEQVHLRGHRRSSRRWPPLRPANWRGNCPAENRIRLGACASTPGRAQQAERNVFAVRRTSPANWRG